MFIGRASLGPTAGGELTALARPQLLATENGLQRRWGKKEGMRRNQGKEKSIVYSPPEFDSIIASAFDV